MGYRGIPHRSCSHAESQARLRQVSHQDIRDTLDEPDTDVPSSHARNRRVLRKRFSATFEVGIVIEPPNEEHSEILVVTAWACRPGD